MSWDPTAPTNGSPADWIKWANDLPISKRLGLVCTEIEAGSATFTLAAPPLAPNPNGSVHGGLLVALADQCMGVVTVRSAPTGLLPATASVHAQFNRPALTPLTLRARVTKDGRTLVFVHVEIEDHDGRICTTAEGTMALVDAAAVNSRSRG